MFSRLSNSMTFLRGLLLLLLTAPAWGQVNVLTQHNDNGRTGANLGETQLSVANVNYNQFGKLFACPVDGQIYAQPLYVSQLAIPSQGTHNVVFVATMNNSVYAFDADAPGAPLWQANFGPSIPAGELEQTPDIIGTVGILGTPVIDPATDTMYFVARTKSGQTGVVTSYVQQLHAIDITTGMDRSGSPVVIQASVPGTGDGAVGGVVAFNPMRENQRPALLLQNNVVYICWGSHTDTTPAHGWLMGYNAWGYAGAPLQQNGVYNTSPNGSLDSLWQAGQGPTVDAAGNIYVETGNGTSDAMSGGSGYGECFLKLTPGAGTLSVSDWFMPSNAATLNAHDLDLGCGGILGLPGTNLLLGGSKQGILYLLDSTNMTNMVHFNASADNIVQEFQACNGHVHGSPIYWNSPATGPTVYVWSEQDYLKAFKFNFNSVTPDQSYLNSTPVSESPMPVPPGMPGGFLSLSANGSTAGSGIIWASHPYNASANQATVSGILRAFDATNLSHELWDSKQLASRDDVGNFAKFCPPTIANGKVYLATFSNKLLVYGLLPVPTGPPAAPTAVVATAGSAQIALSWPSVPTASSYNLYRSLTSGGEGAAPYLTGISSPYTDAPLTNGTPYFYTVTAVNVKGESAQSPEVNATPTAVAGVQINCGGGAAAPFAADNGFTGGSAASVSATIDTSGVTTPAPQAVYGSERYGGSFSYVLPGLTPGAPYTVRLHFAETFWPAAGKRLFAVSINGATVLNNFDVFATAGGENKALVEQFNANADPNGKITLVFTKALDNAMVCGIEALLNAPVTPPATPTGVQAAAGNARVTLTWTAVSGATSYNVYSSVTSGGESVTPPITGISLPTFAATGLANGTPEYYMVTAVNVAGESGPSQEVSATPVDSALTVVNAAAAAPSPATGKTTNLAVLGSDSQGESSITYTWSTTGTVPAPVVFSANGTNAAKNTTATFTKPGTYNFLVTLADGLGASTTSSVSVSVVSTLTSIAVSPATVNVPTGATQTFLASAKDQFGAALTTQPGFTWATTGGGTIGTGGLFRAGTTLGGPFVVAATSGTLSGQAAVTVVTPPAAPTQINCGGGAAAPFAADAGFTGGSTASVTAAIDTSGVTGPAPQAVYQSQRYGNFSYALTGLTPGAPYTVRLHFAETFWTVAGKRFFSVTLNGTQVLNKFDIFAAAGAKNRAVAEQFSANADGNGTITLVFTTQVNNALVCGIEVQPYAAPTSAPAPPASLSAVAGVGQITLSWPASATAASYNLYRGLTPGGEGAGPYKTGLGSGYTDTGLTNGTPYYYTVTAVNQIGESAQSTEAGATPIAPPPTPTQINCGGGAAAPFAADAGFTGGSTASVTAAIDTSGVTGPAPQAVYQSQRYGNFSYALTGLTPGAPYTVRLHFAETYWTVANKRLFNVVLNGQNVLTNFDVFAAAGAKNRAVAEQFSANADSNGTITLQFKTGLNNAMVSGIEIH